MKRIFKGFTLAEVFITLGIIGIIAEMTIPTLIKSYNERITVIKIKKAYSTAQQAYNLLIADGYTMESVFATGSDAYNIFKSKLNFIKSCGTETGCWPSSNWGLYLNGGNCPWVTWPLSTVSGVLTDGTVVLIVSYGSACSTDLGDGPLNNTCGYFVCDITPTKTPQWGRNVFSFYITATGIVPWGSQYDINTPVSDCKINNHGYGCAAKILQEGAINY